MGAKGFRSAVLCVFMGWVEKELGFPRAKCPQSAQPVMLKRQAWVQVADVPRKTQGGRSSPLGGRSETLSAAQREVAPAHL